MGFHASTALCYILMCALPQHVDAVRRAHLSDVDLEVEDASELNQHVAAIMKRREAALPEWKEQMGLDTMENTIGNIIASLQQLTTDLVMQTVAGVQATGKLNPTPADALAQAEETKKLVDKLTAAKLKMYPALQVKGKVENMVTESASLYTHVQEKMDDLLSESKILSNRSDAALQGLIEEKKKNLVQTEKNDIAALLALVAKIKSTIKEVSDLDRGSVSLLQKVDQMLVAATGNQTWAREGVSAIAEDKMNIASEGVVAYAKALKERYDELTVKGAENATEISLDEKVPKHLRQDALSRKQAAAIQAAEAHVQLIIGKQDKVTKHTVAQVIQISTSTDTDALTLADKSKKLIDVLAQSTALQSSATALGAKVGDAEQLINAFFKSIDEFKATRSVNIATHLTGIKSMTDKERADLWKAIDNAYIAKVATFFYQYQVMWYKFSEIGDAVPNGETFLDPLITVAQQDERTKVYTGVCWESAKSIHMWINEIMEQEGVCERFTSCQNARAKVIDFASKHASFCDERTMEIPCVQLQGGHAPDGRKCFWKNSKEEELEIEKEKTRLGHMWHDEMYATIHAKYSDRDRICGSVKAPTSSLPYHQNSEKRGIFY